MKVALSQRPLFPAVSLECVALHTQNTFQLPLCVVSNSFKSVMSTTMGFINLSGHFSSCFEPDSHPTEINQKPHFQC